MVTAISAFLLIYSPPSSNFETVLHPALIVACIGGVIGGAITGLAQTQGNQFLRASQLSDSLGASIGQAMRDDYYNSAVPSSLTRLAVTTLENTLHTMRVLSRMLVKERIAIGSYLVIFLLLMAYRWTSSNWLLFLAQTVFSADIVLRWLKMERFCFRAGQVHEHLRRFFLQGGKVRTPNGTAIVLSAFADYECAKDEAAIPIDSKIFNETNAVVSAEWIELKRTLRIEE